MDWAGDQNGTAIWDYSNSTVAFSSFPGVNPSDYPRVTTIDFYYKDEKGKGQQPPAVAWIKTSGVFPSGDPITYAWDADQKVYRIDSVAGGISVEAYMVKSELRELGAAIGGDYYATGNSLMTVVGSDPTIRDHLLPSSIATVTESNIPEVAEVSAAYLYWSSWKPESSNVPVSPLLPDTCGNFNNWNNGAAWSVYSSSYFQGNYASGPETAKDLTFGKTSVNILNLSSYAAGRVAVSWEQWKSSPIAQNQTRVPTADGDSNGTWTPNPAFGNVAKTTQNDTTYMTGTTDAGGNKTFTFSSFTLPDGAPITDLRIYIRAKRLGTSGTANIRTRIKVNGSYYNGSSNSLNSNSFNTYSTTYSKNPNTGLDWTVDDVNGIGLNPLQQIGVYSNDLNPDALVSMVYALVNYTRPYDAGDALYFSLSSDSGSHFSGNIQAFHADDTSIPTAKPSSANFSYIIPSQYLTSAFKIRFYLDGFDAAQMYCYLDDIKLSVMNPDNSVQFKIDSNWVYYNSTGYPSNSTTSQDLIADTSQVLPNITGSGTPHGFSYACYSDVTALVQKYSAKSPDPALNHPGHATYTVGGVGVTGDTGDEWSYAGWSLILIYSSTETRGHQLYLFDKFIYSDMDTANGLDVDFDDDGQPGGTITGFIVPAQIGNETNAATITCFVGEGDECYSGDFLAFNTDVSYRTHPKDIPMGDKLWDHTNSTQPSSSDDPGNPSRQPNNSGTPNNVWNSKSLGLSAQGVDVDTFYVPWSSGKLNQGETSARIELFTRTDSWNLVYIILSFRSKTTSGSTISYLITRH
jgi:hypothetical protein